MSWVGLTSVIVLIAAALLGVLLYARHRGKISGSVALVIGLLILAGASIVLVYPSSLTVAGGERIASD